MENYASREATVEFLESIGFTAVEPNGDFFDSPGKDTFGPVVQLYIYPCANRYWCVEADGGYKAPVVWNGPRADWDDSDQGKDFVEFLDRNHSGWK